LTLTFVTIPVITYVPCDGKTVSRNVLYMFLETIKAGHQPCLINQPLMRARLVRLLI
jgi:hypothetical protein